MLLRHSVLWVTWHNIVYSSACKLHYSVLCNYIGCLSNNIFQLKRVPQTLCSTTNYYYYYKNIEVCQNIPGSLLVLSSMVWKIRFCLFSVLMICVWLINHVSMLWRTKYKMLNKKYIYPIPTVHSMKWSYNNLLSYRLEYRFYLQKHNDKIFMYDV